MGFLNRKKSYKPPLSPQGAALTFDSDDDMRAVFTFTTERRRRDGVAQVDVAPRLEAGYAYALGMPENNELLAWGEVIVEWPPLSGQALIAQAAVSDEGSLLWWRSGRRLDGLLLAHAAVVGVEEVALSHLLLSLSDAVYMGPTGQGLTGPTRLTVMGWGSGKDGHATRRSLEVVYTMAGEGIRVADLTSSADDDQPLA